MNSLTFSGLINSSQWVNSYNKQIFLIGLVVYNMNSLTFGTVAEESQWVNSYKNWNHLLREVREEMNSLTLPNELACSPSLMAKVWFASLGSHECHYLHQKPWVAPKKAVQADIGQTSHPLDVHTSRRSWASCHAWCWTWVFQHEVCSPDCL